jgi:hypothetical protein
MKKIAAAVAVALGASSAGVQAYTIGTFDFGVLAPKAYATATEGTYIGLISRCGGNVYWSAYDQDSVHIEDDVIPVTPLDMVAFDVGAGIGNKTGPAYMLFQMDRNSSATATPPNKPDGMYDTYDDGCLAGNAFWVDMTHADVTYLPTFPVELEDVNNNQHPTQAGMIGGPNYISALKAGAQAGEWIWQRYIGDNFQPNGVTTQIVTWTVCKSPSRVQTRYYNQDQDWFSAPIDMPNDELNLVDPEDYIIPRNTAFNDGYVLWPVLAASNPNAQNAGADDNLRYCNHKGHVPNNDTQAAVSWSQTYAEVFGAEQTLLNAHACYNAGTRPWDAGSNWCP